jgi:pimeloyl-ACP methyl ester carboxylesterase
MHGKWLGLCVLLVLCHGCTSYIAGKIARPERDNGHRWLADEVASTGFKRETVQTKEGVRIAYWIGSPRDYLVTQQLLGSNAHPHLDMNIIEYPHQASPAPARGSVVLLHPVGEDGTMMASWGLYFGRAGFMVVMPDLRSHGDSGDAPVGYGPPEAIDIADLVRQLRAAGRLPGPLYLFGISYGASVALHAADDIPDVQAVVALEPFANVAQAIERAPQTGLFGHPLLVKWIVTPQRMKAATAEAGKELGVDLEKLDTGDAVARLQTCALIVRGSEDELTDDAQMRAMSERSPWASYVNVPGERHISLPIRTQYLFGPLLEWMMHSSPGLPMACAKTPNLRVAP